jgi:hypothetical protein
MKHLWIYGRKGRIFEFEKELYYYSFLFTSPNDDVNVFHQCMKEGM